MNNLEKLLEAYRDHEEIEANLIEEFNQGLREPDATFDEEGTFGYGLWHLPEGNILRLRKQRDGQYTERYVYYYQGKELEAIKKALKATPKELEETDETDIK